MSSSKSDENNSHLKPSSFTSVSVFTMPIEGIFFFGLLMGFTNLVEIYKQPGPGIQEQDQSARGLCGQIHTDGIKNTNQIGLENSY